MYGYGQQQQYGGQPQQQQPRFMQPQPTGYPGPNMMMQPQPTGFPGQAMIRPQPTGFLQPQPTSFGQQPQFTGSSAVGGGAPPPPMPPMPPQFQQQQQQPSGMGAGGSSFLSPMGQQQQVQPQATGYPMQPQPTSFQSQQMPQQVPQMFTQTFLPAASQPTLPMSQNVNPASMQFNQPSMLGGQSLQQAYQQQNVQQHGQAQVKVPWALSADERKNYDSIFRAWDQQGSGFLTGALAKEVFAQAGLPRDELMQIWNLADTENRGKLNLAEFHVAMGLIFRRLNGNPIPAQLPPELVPPSSRDLGNTVDFMKDLLRHDTNQRYTSGADSPNSQQSGSSSYAKSRSLYQQNAPAQRQDASAYKHDDRSFKTYKSSSRHIDRRAVRAANDDSPTSDLNDMRRALDNSQALLDSSRDAEDYDEGLLQEKDDLMYAIRRIQDDISHNSKGRRTDAKDLERRRLERELDNIKFEKLPALERKMEERESEKSRARRRDAVDRDSRNAGDRGRFAHEEHRSRSKYDYDDQPSRSSSSYQEPARDDDNEDEPRGYMRGTFESSSRRDSPASQQQQSQRSPAPAPPPPSAPKPEAPKPTASPAPTPAMTAEQRKEYIKAEAARRVQERLRSLGIGGDSTPPPASASTSPAPQESAAAEPASSQPVPDVRAEADERERQRQVRLEQERLRDTEKEAHSLQQEQQALQQVSREVTASEVKHPGKAEAAGFAEARDAIDDQEAEMREREAALVKRRAEQQERLRKMQEEVEAEERAAEDFKARKEMFAKQAAASQAPQPRKPAPKPPASRSKPAPAPPAPPAAQPQAPPPPPPPPAVQQDPEPPTVREPPHVEEAVPAPTEVSQAQSPPPPAPPAPVPQPSPGQAKTNPFFRPQGASPQPAPTAPTNTGAFGPNNPFGRPKPAGSPAPVAAPPPPKAPVAAEDDDWDVPLDKDIDESDSEDEGHGGRAVHMNLADAIFGGGKGSAPPSRPESRAAPAAPAPPSAPGAPAAPTAPSAPKAPFSPPPPPADAGQARNALLGQISGGARLKKTQTNDRSGAHGAGAVLGGDPTPPAPAPRAPSPEPVPEPPSFSAPPEPESSADSKRQSVDWYGSLASENARQGPQAPQGLDAPDETLEMEEPPVIPEANGHDDPAASGMEADFSQTVKSYTLYAYSEPSRKDDLSVDENVVLRVHPASDGNTDWVYGETVSGQGGWLPAAYTTPLQSASPFNAVYDYAPGSADELALTEGQTYQVVDQSDASWWKVEDAAQGKVFLVPAAYLEKAEESFATSAPVVSTAAEEEDPLGEDSDDDSPEASAVREAERQQVLEAAGLLSRKPTRKHKRKPPAPPSSSKGSTEPSTVPAAASEEPPAVQRDGDAATEQDVQERTEDAFDRWMALQRELPPLPPAPSRHSLAASTSSQSDLQPPQSPTALAHGSSKPASTASGSSFLSRLLTPSTRDTSSEGLTSSATPIRRVSPTPETAQTGAAQQRTWSSLIDSDALNAIPEKERKRQEAIFELILTESAYVQNLQQLVNVFFSQLAPHLSDKAAQVIFGNVEDILLLNTTLLSDLEARQQEQRLYVDTVGDVLSGHLDQMDIYRFYCANQKSAVRTLDELRSSDSRVADILDRCRVNDLELEHFLLLPMQRLTRLPLLLGQILRYTESSSSEHARLKGCLNTIERILLATNQAVREEEDFETLVELSDTVHYAGAEPQLDLTQPSRLVGKRKIVRHGELAKGRRRKVVHGWLFNDMLLLLKEDEATISHDPIPLEECSLRTSGADDALQIAHRGSTLLLKAPSARACASWVKDMEEQRQACLHALKTGA